MGTHGKVRRYDISFARFLSVKKKAGGAVG
jgi:hypothetical protein